MARAPSIALGVAVLSSVSIAPAYGKPFGVRELVEMTWPGRTGLIEGEPVVVFSPDRRRFFFIQRRGDLAADAQVSELYVYRVADVRRALDSQGRSPPDPSNVVSMRTDADAEAIRSANWLSDSKTIVIVGQANLEKNETFEIYRLDVEKDAIHRASAVGSKDTILANFNVAAEGAIYRQYRSVDSGEDELSSPRFIDIAEYAQATIGSSRVLQEVKFFASYGRDPPWQIGRSYIVVAGDASAYRQTRFTLSPNGREAVVRLADELVPSPRSLKGAGTEPVRVAPSGRYQWVRVDLQTGEYQTLTETDFTQLETTWAAQSAMPKVKSDEPPARERSKALQVVVREDANTPPRVVAMSGKRELALGRSDSVLDGVDIAPVEAITWTDAAGRTGKGGLLLPMQRKPGERLPAVIQILHQFPMDRFRPGGLEPVATFAGQALASQGFAVLQFDCDASGVPLDAQEAPTVVQLLDGAVEYLDRRGIIDPSRVGIVGHSRTAFRVNLVLTNPGRTRFAAAISNEGFSGSYVQYLQYGLTSRDNMALVENNFHKRYEGGDFWHRKSSWVAGAPGFNLEKVSTPLLLTASSNGRALMPWEQDLETYAGLKLLGKPVDYLYYPKGSHVMRWSKGRFASQQITVDWMSFWLKGEVTVGPEQQLRNARWAKLRPSSPSQGSR